MNQSTPTPEMNKRLSEILFDFEHIYWNQALLQIYKGTKLSELRTFITNVFSAGVEQGFYKEQANFDKIITQARTDERKLIRLQIKLLETSANIEMGIGHFTGYTQALDDVMNVILDNVKIKCTCCNDNGCPACDTASRKKQSKS